MAPKLATNVLAKHYEDNELERRGKGNIAKLLVAQIKLMLAKSGQKLPKCGKATIGNIWHQTNTPMVFSEMEDHRVGALMHRERLRLMNFEDMHMLNIGVNIRCFRSKPCCKLFSYSP